MALWWFEWLLRAAARLGRKSPGRVSASAAVVPDSLQTRGQRPGGIAVSALVPGQVVQRPGQVGEDGLGLGFGKDPVMFHGLTTRIQRPGRSSCSLWRLARFSRARARLPRWTSVGAHPGRGNARTACRIETNAPCRSPVSLCRRERLLSDDGQVAEKNVSPGPDQGGVVLHRLPNRDQRPDPVALVALQLDRVLSDEGQIGRCALGRGLGHLPVKLHRLLARGQCADPVAVFAQVDCDGCSGPGRGRA